MEKYWILKLGNLKYMHNRDHLYVFPLGSGQPGEHPLVDLVWGFSSWFVSNSLHSSHWPELVLIGFCPPYDRTGITTSDPVSSCLMVAHWLLEARPALWPSGTWPPRRPASRLSSPRPPQRATPWLSAPTPKSASPAAVMETSPFGTCTTRLLLG